MAMLELVLRRTTLTCAVLLLFGMAGDQTTWVWGNGQRVTDGAVYNLAATGCGAIALLSLAVALNTRPRRALPLLALMAAIGVYVLSAIVSGVSVWAQTQGEVWLYGATSQYTSPLGAFAGNSFASAGMVYPAQAPAFFTAIAVIGAMASLGLGLAWTVLDRNQGVTVNPSSAVKVR